jgi:hypothetical protein
VTLHHSFAYVVVLFAVALLAVSFCAKVKHGARWAAIPFVHCGGHDGPGAYDPAAQVSFMVRRKP